MVAQGDAKSLTAVPRIGPKLAQKLLLEYKDKLGAPHGSVPAQKPIAAGPAPWQDQLQAALVGLGYAPREADEAVTAVTPRPRSRPSPTSARCSRPPCVPSTAPAKHRRAPRSQPR